MNKREGSGGPGGGGTSRLDTRDPIVGGGGTRKDPSGTGGGTFKDPSGGNPPGDAFMRF